jgi:uncharacterized lipoprotein YehR (DUF1307 family)
MNRLKQIKLLISVLSFALVGCQERTETYEEQTAFTFNDGETTYTLIEGRLIKPDSTNPIKIYTRIEPTFEKSIKVLDKPIIDTLYDALDPKIILAVDTTVSTHFKYNREITYGYEKLTATTNEIKKLAADQGLSLFQTQYVILTANGFDWYYWQLPAESDIANAEKLLVTYKLRGEKYVLRYPVLFSN